ncbi:hypothetical protein NMY22_g8763 [Coprinellus aureogranulatus]|nr:hypothetical protein NMY22_g8763 [Coprinellus aureogranulatus]
MAEAVFEEHPLEQYLRDAGEVHELMPGASLELLNEIDIDRHLYQEGDFEGEMEWRPHCVIVGLNAVESFLSSAKPSSASNPFVERFKYNVISSSLLSTSLSNPQSARSSIPGRLPHSRSTSLDLQEGALVYAPSQHYGPISIAAFATAVFAGLGSRGLATLSLGCLSYFAYHLIKLSESPCHDFTPTFTALDELVSSNHTWESTVQDALQELEKEEANLLRTSTPSSTPTHSLRVSLHTTLQATRTQCDNVRQLFSALTCPTELAQLSEIPVRDRTRSPRATRPFPPRKASARRGTLRIPALQSVRQPTKRDGSAAKRQAPVQRRRCSSSKIR